MGLFSKLFSFARRATGSTAAPGDLRETVDRRLGQIKAEREALQSGALDRKRREKEEDTRRADPAWRFVHMGEALQTPHSSNVASTWYEIDQQALYIQYKDGSLYEYRDVTPGEAESMYRAPSHGKWVWDNLRIRGKGGRYGARKEYALVSSGSRGRAWEKSPQVALEHSEKVAKASGAKSPFERLGKMARKKPK